MINLQETKDVVMKWPTAINNNTSPSTTTVDTNGWDYAQIKFFYGASDIALTALKVQESDDDSTYADVTGLIWGTSTNVAGSTSTLPSATDDNKIFTFDIDMRGRKRYLKLVYTVGNGTTGAYATAVCTLGRAKDGPSTAAERGAAEILRV